MPFVGDVQGMKPGYASSFSHNNEEASPGYYRVFLEEYGIDVEFAAAQRSAMANFSYPAGEHAGLLLEVNQDSITVVDESTLSGQYGSYRFVIEFDQPFMSIEKVSNGTCVLFGELEKTNLIMKIGLSMVSVDGAMQNMATELPQGWDFLGLRQQARKAWADELGRIEVEGGTARERTIFYTALYHSFLLPHVISDVDGNYRGADGKIHSEPDRIHYTAFSPWDTFRTLHPLLTFLMPDRQSDMVHSLITEYEQGRGLRTGPMTGNHAVPIIVDSYFKGAADFDIELAYQAMRAALMEPPYGRGDISSYLEYGYVPAELNYSVTKTVEYAYNDWTLMRFAELLGKSEDALELAERSLYYRNVFNGSIRLTMPKYADGSWAEDREGYNEGNTWVYSWFVPHNVQDLVNLMGGRLAFAELLDRCFDEGHYVHDNEPPLHYAYLYAYSGHPWKVQDRVREIMENSYLDTPGGIRGNDDLGSMSSWYVFSALGFYPVCPGVPEYVLTSPIFTKSVIHLPNGEQLVIESPAASTENKYIQSVAFEQEEREQPWIEHAKLAAGGNLTYELGSSPNKSWGSLKEHAPYSLTTGEPMFTLSDLRLSTDVVETNEPFDVHVVVSNTSDVPGTVELQLIVDDEHVASEWVLVNGNETKEFSIETRLHALGSHHVGVNSLEPQTVTVNVGLPF